MPPRGRRSSAAPTFMTVRTRRSFLLTAAGISALRGRARAASPPRPTLRFGVITEQSHEPDRMLRIYSDLLAELRTALDKKGFDVDSLVIAQDLSDLTNRLARKEVDMVAETLFVTLDLQTDDLFSVQPSLAMVRRNQREYHS